jgi:hypothetical protein
MKKRYSFSSRRTGHLENIKKQRPKYPKIAEKVLNSSDIIVQVLDARFVFDTRNMEIEDFIKEKNKKIIHAVNKYDLVEKVKRPPRPFVLISCKERKGIKDLRDRIKILASRIGKEKIIVGILGYPNTGKSSLINLLVGRASAKTGAEPGLTKSLQKLKLTENVFILDTPGVIPGKEYTTIANAQIARHVKVGARTYSRVRDPEQIVTELMRELPGILERHYKIESNGDSEILLEKLGEQKNFLKKGGVVDVDRTARFVLREWQEGKISVK